MVGAWVGNLLGTLRGAAGADFQALIAAQAGKVSWWKLDETSGTNAADAAGTNPGTHSLSANTNQTSLLTSGVGKSALYNASNTVVTNAASLQLAGDLSVEMLIRPATIPGAGQAWFLSKDNSYGIGFHNGLLAFLIRDTLGTFNYLDANAAGDVVAGNTYHIVGTWTNSTKVQRLYINGALNKTGGALGAGVNVNAINLTLGSWPDGGERFDGRLDEVVLYSAVLSAPDIAAHAAAR